MKGPRDLHRGIRYAVLSQADLARVLVLTGAASVVVDVEPLIVRWGGTEKEYSRGLVELIETLTTRSTHLRTIIVASNSPRPRPPWKASLNIELVAVIGARKPYRTSYLRHIRAPVVVVGDQVLTDGILALRIGATFCHWQTTKAIPWWPRLQRLVGHLIARLLFVTRSVEAD
jgi:predicted HAD superfamily phosphohydrolase YqeG